MGISVRIAIAVQHYLATKTAYCVDLDLWCGRGHHDDRPRTQLVSAQRHTLGMVAGGCANYALGQLRCAELRHLVIRTPQFKAAHRLLVFALEQNRVVQTFAQLFGGLQSRLNRYIVDTGRQNFFQVVVRRQMSGLFGRHGRGQVLTHDNRQLVADAACGER